MTIRTTRPGVLVRGEAQFLAAKLSFDILGIWRLRLLIFHVETGGLEDQSLILGTRKTLLTDTRQA
jgi:hypothetical protein